MLKVNKPIYVTRPALPPLEEFTESLQVIWDSRMLTNNGPFHQQFEKALADYLGVKYISLFANGTLALVMALKAMRITGEVITTPYSFVGTTNSLLWHNLKPVFVDIEPETCNINPEKIEAAITPKTSAIMPVHVYGNPCGVKRIQDIADRYGLKVIYDACHTFGVTLNGVPVLNSGNLSVMSFHATKVFNTLEGGAIVCHDETMKKRIDSLGNFGHDGEETAMSGINGKMNEIQAAMGLMQLKYIDENIEKRRQVVMSYRQGLSGVPGLRFLDELPGVKHCYSYFPIFVDAAHYGMSRDALYEKFRSQDIHCRCYFHPLISQLPACRELESAQPGLLPMAEIASEQVICLPLFPDLDSETVNRIIGMLNVEC
jgi:dTDP-4-amino-4,6-dideoxygalactose transaminase